MQICDVCGYPTTTKEGTGYTAEEFRKMVFSMGFEPDENIINAHVAMGRSRYEAIDEWKNVLVAGSSTGWLLCPKCAARASRYLYKPAGSGMEGMGATETMGSVIRAAALSAQQNKTFRPSSQQDNNKVGRKILIYSLLAIVIIAFIVMRRLTSDNQTINDEPQVDKVIPEVYFMGLGGGYGLAFGHDNVLYATGRNDNKPVLWKITATKAKEVHAILDYGDPMVALMAPSGGHETNIVVDGEENVWISGRMNGQCYVVSKKQDVRAIYLNQHISVPFQFREEDTKGIAWDEDDGKLYVITSGPSSTYATDAIRHLTTLTPSAGKFANELNTERNGWDKPPLFINNKGILIEQTGIALVKAKGSPLFLIGHDRVFVLQSNGKAEPFGKAFDGMRLYGAAADQSGNLFVSANSNINPDNGRGAIYKLDESGNKTLFLEDFGKPLGVNWHDGYLYFMEYMGDQILRMKTTE
jgi:sugar lactone lactonase YvrE